MKKSFILLGIVLTPPAAFAQDGDNTGTNPINFTYDWRSHREMLDLGSGDNSLTIQTIQQRFPVGKTQLQIRVRHSSLSLDPDGNGTSTETSGIGDWDARLLYVPKVSASGAIAVGMEAGIPAASNDFLGNGKWTLGPQVFLVKFRPGLGATLIAPAYQYVFSVAGDDARADVSRSQFDIFGLWLDTNKRWWFMANPQAVIDHENDLGFALFEVEYGRMMFAGLSAYSRPSLGIGTDRPYDWSVELGLKIIWR